MRKIPAGATGSYNSGPQMSWTDLSIPQEWQRVIAILHPGTSPRKVQQRAIEEFSILDSRRNLIVSAPTNSGKSLVGWLSLLASIQRGQRGVLLEPMRAIAQEKFDEISAKATELGKALGHPFRVQISTGDYRLTYETFAAPPPNQGELIIATPERFDAILRNPKYAPWFSSIGTVCVDEAHLVGAPKRGATLEFLITSLLCLASPPRLLLLSATMGDTDRARDWLEPCDVIIEKDRQPPLSKEVLALTADENANEVILNLAEEILVNTQSNLLIFVYQTQSAERVARSLGERLNQTANTQVKAYHSKMSSANRAQVRENFMHGLCRCIVTTTALGLGVNLPATHVLVRDTSFPGVGRLELGELVQMMGRAGRGQVSGFAAALVRSGDGWEADDLARAMEKEELPHLVSWFERPSVSLEWRNHRSGDDKVAIATLVAGYLARSRENGQDTEGIQRFFGKSLGGRALVSGLSPALNWLVDPRRVIAFLGEDQRYRLTALGENASEGVLPFEVAAGFAQLLRDLLTIDSEDRLLINWRPLDHLLVAHLLYSGAPTLRNFSANLARQVDIWVEQNPNEAPLLFRQWISGEEGASKAAEVLGSLGISETKEQTSKDWARKKTYHATFQSILLYERSRGRSVDDLERRWGIKNFEGVEERWRDDLLWLLSGLDRILKVRCFYYHLKEVCKADADRVRSVDHRFKRMHYQIRDLLDQLKYCSSLGPILYSIRRSTQAEKGHVIGVGSIRRLEEAGITDLATLYRYKLLDLIQLGIHREQAEQIISYLRRRRQ